MTRREKIYILIDIVLIAIIISVYGYTTYQIKMFDKNFNERCRALYLGLDPEWLIEMRFNESVNKTLAKLNRSWFE